MNDKELEKKITKLWDMKLSYKDESGQTWVPVKVLNLYRLLRLVNSQAKRMAEEIVRERDKKVVTKFSYWTFTARQSKEGFDLLLSSRQAMSVLEGILSETPITIKDDKK